MTVAELIAELAKWPSDMMVLTRGYESGYDPIHSVKEIQVIRQVNPEWWDGEWDDPTNYHGPTTSAIILRKGSTSDDE